MLALATERLIATRLQAADLDILCAMHRDRAVMTALGGVRSDARTRDYLARNLAHWARHGYGLWIFRHRVEGRFVGRGGLRHVTLGGVPEVEITYALMPDFWGRGLATEMATALLGVAFRHLALAHVVAFALPSNHASRRIMEKLGFRFEREIVSAGLPHVLYRLHR